MLGAGVFGAGAAAAIAAGLAAERATTADADISTPGADAACGLSGAGCMLAVMTAGAGARGADSGLFKFARTTDGTPSMSGIEPGSTFE